MRRDPIDGTDARLSGSCSEFPSEASRLVCAPARANVVGQATARSLLGAVHLAGVACEAKKKWRSIYHGTCAAHFHSSVGVVVDGQWECGGMGRGWWVVHLNIAPVLSSLLVHTYSSLSFVSS